jgi:hypothetical protein
VHADCFAYAGGCSVFGCGSRRAVFRTEPPQGWQREGPADAPDGGWLVPARDLLETALTAHINRTAGLCRRYWQGCSQLEFFSLVGQTWLALVCVIALGFGLWQAPAPFLAAAGLLLCAHLNALAGLVRLWVGTAALPADKDPILLVDDLKRAAAPRLRSIRRSRVMLRLSGLLLALAFLTGPGLGPTWPALMVAATVVFPWFSLMPRWKIETPLLSALTAPAEKDDSPRLPV